MLRTLLFTLLLPSISIAQQRTYTHYKEHYLQGKVKTMYTRTYECYKDADSNYQKQTRIPYNISIYHFNRQGNITAAQDTQYEISTATVKGTTRYNYHYDSGIYYGYDAVTSNGLNEYDLRRSWFNDSTYIEVYYYDTGGRNDTVFVNIRQRRPYHDIILLKDKKGNTLRDVMILNTEGGTQYFLCEYEYIYY